MAWLQGLPISMWAAQSDYGYPILLSIHSIGMAAVVGILLIFSIRVLGYATSIPLQAIEQLLPIAWLGFFLNLGSGSVLFMAAMLLRPGHADPAACAHRARERGIETGPGFRPLHRFARGELGFQEVADLLTERLGFRGGRGRGKGKRGHGHSFSTRLPAGSAWGREGQRARVDPLSISPAM